MFKTCKLVSCYRSTKLPAICLGMLMGIVVIESNADLNAGTMPPANATLYSLDQDASSYFTGVIADDFNADGKLDLAWSSYHPATAAKNFIKMADVATTHTIKASEVYGAGSVISADEGPYNITKGDFNGDGHADLIYYNRQGTFMLYRNSTAIGTAGNQFYNREGGGSWFTTLMSDAMRFTPTTTATIVNAGATGSPTAGPNMFAEWRNADNTTPQGSGGLSIVQTHDLGGGAQMIGLGDITGDGTPEAFFFHPSNDFTCRTLSGALPSSVSGGAPDQIKGPGAGTGANHGPFDGTNLPDESIHPGGYSFRMKTGFIVEAWEGCKLVVGDLSQDGRPEMIANMYADDGKGYLFSYQRKAANFGPGHTTGEVATGDRGYEWEVIDILDTEKPSCVTLGDYNDDGVLDMVVGTRSGKVYGYQRISAGYNANNAVALNDYTRQQIYVPTGANPCPVMALAVADLDGDGHNEIAFTTSLAGVTGTADPIPGTYLLDAESGSLPTELSAFESE